MYTCHLGVYRRSLAVELGGFQSKFDGCQDYDFVLRLAERTDRIAHIPRILYHWRAHASSTAGGDQAKPYAYLAQPGAIADHLRRSGIDAEVQFGHLPGLHRMVHRVSAATSVDLVLAVEHEQGLSDAASLVAGPAPSRTGMSCSPRHPTPRQRRHHRPHHCRHPQTRITTVQSTPPTTRRRARGRRTTPPPPNTCCSCKPRPSD